MALQNEVELLAASLIAVEADPVELPTNLPSGLAPDYLEFLALTNGGYTKDRFMHFFGAKGPKEHDVVHWNDPKTWKENFHLDDRCFVFAEDVLGNQYYFYITERRKVAKAFCIDDGSSLPCATGLSDFIDNVVNNSEVTAEPLRLLSDFLRSNGPGHPPFTHLSNKIPACLGGNDSDIDNLEWENSIDHLNFMGQLVTQLRSVPPGTVVKDVMVDPVTKKVVLVF